MWDVKHNNEAMRCDTKRHAGKRGINNIQVQYAHVRDYPILCGRENMSCGPGFGTHMMDNREGHIQEPGLEKNTRVSQVPDVKGPTS